MGRGTSQRFLPFSALTEASPPFFRFFSLFEKHGGYKTGKLKLKRPEQLQVRWWIWLAGAVLWKDRGQDESLASQDLASCVDILLFPPGGAGHHTAAIGWTGERTRWWDRGEDGEIGAVKICAGDVRKGVGKRVSIAIRIGCWGRKQTVSLSCRYGHFSGINRKVQLTYYPHGVKASNEGQGET